ncbi:MAG: exonuclease SbcCD subunit D [Faecalibacterium sp.]|nr:exonuclease SbcCD subunit D [Faecalibacterium sp.]
MKFFHLSDLHLGKRLHECSLLEDQKHILQQVLTLAQQHQPAAVIIAGDLYDKPVPPAEAVHLCDEFLTRLSAMGCTVLLTSGNHDSAERVAFGAQLLQKGGVYISPPYDQQPVSVTLQDEQGEVDFWLLPFLKPAPVRHVWAEQGTAEDYESYNSAVRFAVNQLPRRAGVRSVLAAHQFVTGASRCDSEEVSVGGVDNVEVSAFAGFDYVALGHIHSPQSVGRPTVRYCGSPLAYSFSEAGQQKSVTMVELTAEETIVHTLPLAPLRAVRRLRGSFLQLTDPALAAEDYLYITLTDEDEVPQALGRLRGVYPNLLCLDYDNRRTRAVQQVAAAELAAPKTPLQHFMDLYEQQNNQPMTARQAEFCAGLIESIWEKEAGQ